LDFGLHPQQPGGEGLTRPASVCGTPTGERAGMKPVEEGSPVIGSIDVLRPVNGDRFLVSFVED